MAATAQAQRSTSAAKSSTKVTPITHAASVAVCRNLLRASVGQVSLAELSGALRFCSRAERCALQICYQRGVFDEDAFDVVKMAGTTVRCLQRAPEGKAGAAPELVQVHQLARCLEEGVAEAMQLGYLRAVVLAFQAGHPAESKPGHPAPLLEAYTLKVSYSDSHEVSIVLQELEGLPQHAGPEAIFNNKAASVSLAAGIKAQASTMMRSVITMCHTLRPLPDDTIVTLKLYYYDERVPDDWQPPHFQDVTGQDDVLFESQAGLIKTPIGKTSTLHHRLSLKSTHLQSMELPGESENVDGVICDEDALPVTKGGGSASEKAAALASADVQDPALLARLQKAILARGSVSIKALGAQLDMASSAVQACLIQLEGIGFVKRRAGLGVRYQIADAGALVRPAHQPAQTSSGTANLDAIPAAQLDAMLLLDSLHVANTNFITARQVQSEHGISDKAVAQATLAWLEKQGCLERAKQANLGRKVLRDKHALSLLCTFRSALVSSGRRLASTRDTSAYTSEERTQHLLAQAQARHKAHVAAMYESAAAARVSLPLVVYPCPILKRPHCPLSPPGAANAR